MIEQKLYEAKRYAQRGDMAQAHQLYRSILNQEPQNAAALQGLRALAPQLTVTDAPSPAQLSALESLYLQGQYQALIEQTQTLAASFPKVALLHNIIGSAYKELGQLDAAIVAYHKAISIAPNHHDAYSNMGMCLKKQGEYDKAVEAYAMALLLNPNDAGIHSDLGLLYKAMGRMDEAIQEQRYALQIEPDYALVHTRLGILFKDLRQYEQSIACHRRAIEINPDFADAYTNLAITNSYLTRYDEALAHYARAVSLSPEAANIRFNRSLIMLLTGDFSNGWREYEWRPNGSKNGVEARGFAQPIWLGDSDIGGKTILIHSEQGLGDTLQFCRYVKPVADLGAKVIFEVHAKLEPLFEPFKAYAQLVSKENKSLPEFEVHCPLLSLPLAFATELDTIPSEVEYLHVSSHWISHWQTRLGRRARPRIGLAWSGNSQHPDNHLRSLPLATLLEYLPADYEYISLHHEADPKDQSALARIRYFGEELSGFDTTAGLYKNLDLIISVDTSLGHLGGALNLPTWIVLAFPFDFRWLLNRSDSPWYPSVRLFRQPAPGDWPGVLTAVARALDEQKYD